MSQRPPQLTTSDLAAWRKLVREAERAGCGSETLGNLATAAKAARRCVVPGELSKVNPFVKLQRAAELFVQAKPGQRLELAGELGSLTAECRELLGLAALGEAKPGGPPPDPPPRRERADIDG